MRTGAAARESWVRRSPQTSGPPRLGRWTGWACTGGRWAGGPVGGPGGWLGPYGWTVGLAVGGAGPGRVHRCLDTPIRTIWQGKGRPSPALL